MLAVAHRELDLLGVHVVIRGYGDHVDAGIGQDLRRVRRQADRRTIQAGLPGDLLEPRPIQIAQGHHAAIGVPAIAEGMLVADAETQHRHSQRRYAARLSSDAAIPDRNATSCLYPYSHGRRSMALMRSPSIWRSSGVSIASFIPLRSSSQRTLCIR